MADKIGSRLIEKMDGQEDVVIGTDDDKSQDSEPKEWERDPIHEKCMKISENLQVLLDQKAEDAD